MNSSTIYINPVTHLGRGKELGSRRPLLVLYDTRSSTGEVSDIQANGE